MAAEDPQQMFDNGFLNDVTYGTNDVWKPISLTHVQYIKGQFQCLQLNIQGHVNANHTIIYPLAMSCFYFDVP